MLPFLLKGKNNAKCHIFLSYICSPVYINTPPPPSPHTVLCCFFFFKYKPKHLSSGLYYQIFFLFYWFKYGPCHFSALLNWTDFISLTVPEHAAS